MVVGRPTVQSREPPSSLASHSAGVCAVASGSGVCRCPSWSASRSPRSPSGNQDHRAGISHPRPSGTPPKPATETEREGCPPHGTGGCSGTTLAFHKGNAGFLLPRSSPRRVSACRPSPARRPKVRLERRIAALTKRPGRGGVEPGVRPRPCGEEPGGRPRPARLLGEHERRLLGEHERRRKCPRTSAIFGVRLGWGVHLRSLPGTQVPCNGVVRQIDTRLFPTPAS